MKKLNEEKADGLYTFPPNINFQVITIGALQPGVLNKPVGSQLTILSKEPVEGQKAVRQNNSELPKLIFSFSISLLSCFLSMCFAHNMILITKLMREF